MIDEEGDFEPLHDYPVEQPEPQVYIDPAWTLVGTDKIHPPTLVPEGGPKGGPIFVPGLVLNPAPVNIEVQIGDEHYPGTVDENGVLWVHTHEVDEVVKHRFEMPGAPATFARYPVGTREPHSIADSCWCGFQPDARAAPHKHGADGCTGDKS